MDNNGSGFYKNNNNGELLHAPNFVYGPSFELTREAKMAGDEGKGKVMRLPVDGWYWFDSRQEALDFFGLIEEPETVYDLVKSILAEQGIVYEPDISLKQYPAKKEKGIVDPIGEIGGKK